MVFVKNPPFLRRKCAALAFQKGWTPFGAASGGICVKGRLRSRILGGTRCVAVGGAKIVEWSPLTQMGAKPPEGKIGLSWKG